MPRGRRGARHGYQRQPRVRHDPRAHPGSAGPSFGQGVGVEVGESEAAIDLDIVVEYGVGIAELGRSIQRNVKQAVERMTGLRVVEVNIAVDDVYLPDDSDQPAAAPSRVA